MGRAGVDRVEVGAQGNGSCFFDGVLVEELSPQGGDALCVRIIESAIGGILGDDARVLSEASRSVWKAPSMGRSAGIVCVASQVPLTWR